jgi:post-segregation antitoxin (ccd killing protein)
MDRAKSRATDMDIMRIVSARVRGLIISHVIDAAVQRIEKKIRVDMWL